MFSKKYEYLEEDIDEIKKTSKSKENIDILTMLKKIDNESEVEIEFEKENNNTINLNLSIPREFIEEYNDSKVINFSLNLSKSILQDILKLLK